MTPPVRAALGVGIALVCAAFVGNRLADSWPEARHTLASASLGWIVLGVVLAASGMVSVALGWRGVLAFLGHDLPADKVVRMYFAGEIGKYVPGMVWAVVGRGELATRAGVPRRAAYTSVGMSLALWYAAAAGWAAMLVPLLLIAVALVVVIVLLAKPAFVGLVVRYVPAWAFIGGATWCMARALDSHASLAELVPAAALSWLVGFLVVPAPGGAGVREAVFVAAAGSLDGGVAASAAVLARLAFIAVDAVGAVLGSRS
jgi:glycosyltransferase 2 family protein